MGDADLPGANANDELPTGVDLTGRAVRADPSLVQDMSLVISADKYKYWHIDFQTGLIRVIYQDGQIFEDELEAEYRRVGSQVASSTFDWDRWWITSTTTRGDCIVTEGFNPRSVPPFHGRPSVYLDQNKWRTVADVLHDPGRVRDSDERRAAQDVIRLAADGGIVLPLSTGHLLETGGLYGDRRYEIGVAMVSLASGWQIRNPLDLWKHEAELFVREFLNLREGVPALHPITTEPGALFGKGTSLGITDQTPDIETFMSMLTMPSVILDVIVDPEKMLRNPISQWVDHHTAITAQIRDEQLPKEQRRLLARRRYWNENIGFYTSTYRRITSSTDFPTFSDAELARILAKSPMVGLLSELFIRRFIDRMTVWKRNDLVDMLHLCGASGYADYVCCETHTGTQIKEAQRTLSRRVTVFTSLHELVVAVRRGGARADSERESTIQ